MYGWYSTWHSKWRKSIEASASRTISSTAEDLRHYTKARKKLTGVALDEHTLQELKALAAHQGIPYQVLIRVFLLRSIESMKQAP